jgi:hypothetical protein
MNQWLAKQSNKGQTITEYAMAAFLVAVVGLGALMSFSSMLSGGLPGFLDRLFEGSGGSGGASGGGAGGPGGGEVGSLPGNPGGDTSDPAYMNGVWPNNQTVCMESVCLAIPVVSKSDLETAGGLGSDLTDAYADVLNQIAKNLADDPNADPALLKRIQELANMGHDIASEQRTLAGVVEQNCPGKACLVPLAQAGNVFTFPDANKDGKPDVVDNFSARYGELISYMDANPDAVPPGIKQIVALEGDQIIRLADGTTWICNTAADYHYSGGAYGDTFFSADPRNRANIIDQDANVICGAGQGGANCTVGPPNGGNQTAQGND